MIAQNVNRVKENNPAPALIEYAATQGAPVEAFLAAGWAPHVISRQGRPALQFATGTGPRWRFMDGHKPKYTSPPGYARCWYELARAVELARRHAAPLVICNGEAGTIAAQWHGVPAACITGGETGTIAAQLLTELQQGYSGPLLVAYDCDDTGRRAGAALAAELRAAGYAAAALDLGGPEKFDLADFCKLHAGGALAALLDCPTLPEVAPRPRPAIAPRENGAPVTGGAVNWPAENDLWWQDIVLPAVERAAVVRRGKHFRCINPAHEDKHPSARITEQGVYICTCGAHKRELVAAWAGAPDFLNWWKDQRRALYPAPAPAPKPAPEPPAPNGAWWPDGMPDVWRAQIRRWYGPAAETAAETINRAVCAGTLDPANFTVAQAVEAARAAGENVTRTLTRGISQLAANEYLSTLDIEDTQETTKSKTDKYSAAPGRGRGQPAKHFRLNPLSGAIARVLALAAPAIYQAQHPVEGDAPTAAQWTGDMLAALDVSPEAAADVNAALQAVWAAQGGTRHTWAAQQAAGALAELRRKLLSDATATRPAPGIDASGTVGRAAAHLRAQVEAGAPPRSYAALAADLGISRASVPAVLRRAGIVQVAQTATRAVTSADELPKQARRFAGQVRGRVLNVLIESEGGQVERLNYQGAASAEMVARHLAAGRTVKFEARCASAQQAGVSERDLTPDRTGQ